MLYFLYKVGSEFCFLLSLEYPLKDLLKNSEKLVQYLWSRHPPAEQPDIQLKAQEIEESIIEKGKHLKQCRLTLFI